MTDIVHLFWPGDYRPTPNDLAMPMIEASTVQMEKALDHLGVKHKRIGSLLTKPNESIEKLSNIDGPLIGIYAHWVYGPHTVDGVVGKDTPLLLASNFDGTWPGLVGLLNTAACLEMVDRKASRIWTDAKDWTLDQAFMKNLALWLKNGKIDYDESSLTYQGTLTSSAEKHVTNVLTEFSNKRPLALMLGDTSMGMINGYFGPRLLSKVGFSEHKIDQSWIIERGANISQARIDAAYEFVCNKGITFHYQGDFTPDATKDQLRDYLAVLDMVEEFGIDCIGWQYQLGLIGSRPPSDFAEGLFNSVCRPESNGDTITTATEADQGNLIPQEMMKRLLKSKGLHQAVFFHDIRWGDVHDGKFLWLLLNSGSSGAYAFNHDQDTLKGVHSYRQAAEYFPIPGGTFAGESKAGEITWARAYVKAGELWMDIGKGDVIELPATIRDKWWQGTTPQWPFMAADLGIGRDTLMAHFMSNHIAVAYGDIFEEMVELSQRMNFKVRILKDKD